MFTPAKSQKNCHLPLKFNNRLSSIDMKIREELVYYSLILYERIYQMEHIIELIFIPESNKYKDTNLKYFRKQIQLTLDKFLKENEYSKKEISEDLFAIEYNYTSV